MLFRSRSGEQIMEIFQSLNDEGVTIVMITHEPEIAAHAKRTLHIRDGLLVNSSGKPIASKPAVGPAGAGPASSVASPAPAAAGSTPTVSKAPAPAVDRTGEIVTPRVKAPRLPKLPKLPKPGKHKAPINAEEAPAAPAPSVPQQAPQVSAPAAPKPPREEISGQTIIESLERQLEALNKKQDPSGPAKGEGPANE